jgi:membrane protease YdiL (CAAX protease family)
MSQLSPQDMTIVAVAFAVIAGVVVLVDGLLIIVWLWHRDAVVAGEREPVFARKWSLVDPWVGGQVAFALLVWIFFLAAFAVSFRAAVSGSAGRGAMPEMNDVWFVLAALMVQNALLIAVPVVYLNYRYGVRVRDVGFSLQPTKRQVLLGIGLGVALVLVNGVAEAGMSSLAEHALPGAVWQTIERLSKAFSAGDMLKDVRTSWWQFAVVFLGIAVATPIGEEFFFRAFLHNCAKRRLGRVWGTLLSASAFALVHGGPLLVVAILPVGIVLAWAYDRTGSLWVPIIIHGVNNGLALLALRFLPEQWV